AESVRTLPFGGMSRPVCTVVTIPAGIAMTGPFACRERDRRRASFDKLRMRTLFCASKISPHPGLVEGHRIGLQKLGAFSGSNEERDAFEFRYEAFAPIPV